MNPTIEAFERIGRTTDQICTILVHTATRGQPGDPAGPVNMKELYASIYSTVLAAVLAMSAAPDFDQTAKNLEEYKPYPTK